MDADGKNAIQLTNNDLFDLYPAWSPDGQKIAFSSKEGNKLIGENLNIYLMNPDGSDVGALTDNNISSGPLSWSPDGYHIAFTLLSQNENFKGGGIYIMKANGDKQKPLIDFPDSNEGSPIWLPQ